MDIIKILLVAPDISSKRENQNDFVYFSSLVNKPSKKQTGDKMGVLPLALPTLAALTPPEFDVRIIDENIEDIDFNAPVDIVGITFLTSYARQGYEVADKFRDAGIHVALGGVHVTMCPEEALQHADTVFVGEADDTWEMFLDDFKRGKPKRLYEPEKRPDLKRLVIPRWDLVKNEYYRSCLVQTSRGCHFDCDFCSVPRYLGPLRTKPVENVIEEIKATKSYGRIPGIHYVYFADEDVICNKAYAKKLFKAMIPLKVRWVSQVSINIAMDDELLDLAARSGCEAVFIGFESIVQENLNSLGKGKLNQVQFFKEAIDKLNRKGIVVFGFFMFGFDGDDTSVFKKTVDFINETPLALPIINILGPMPGTRFYDRMKAEGRLLEASWELFDARNVLFTPKKMSPDTLLKGVNWSLRKLYSADAVLDRIDRLWDIGGLRSEKTHFLLRLKLTLLLAFDSLSRGKDFAPFIRRMICEMWVKKKLSFTTVFAALSFYDFARKLPDPSPTDITNPTEVWVGTWGTALQLVEPGNMPPEPGLSDNTLRQVVRISLGGNRLRARFSNEFGTSPVTLNAVHIATSAGGSAIAPGTDQALKFDGEPQVTIEPGTAIKSDPFQFTLEPRTNVAITIHFGDTSPEVTGHPGSRTTSYLLSGNKVSSADFSDAVQTDHWYIINGIDVGATESTAAVVALGNSVTDGRGSGTNKQNRWPDELARRLQENPDTRHVAVLNMGIGGNCVVCDCLGPTALSRYERDVIEQTRARWLIILEGINDIGQAEGAEAATAVAGDLIAAYEQMIDRAHAEGIRVYGATLFPFGGSSYDTVDREAARKMVNEWIRSSGRFDAVIDLDVALRDPENLLRLLPAADTGDHLHPNETGHRIIAEAVDLTLFK